MPSAYRPRRIACLQPSATVILPAVGELARVVTGTRYCADVVPALADGSRAILASSWTANAAQMVAGKPDLVLASVPYQDNSVSETLEAGVAGVGIAEKS
jgi:ABC-type Fe3+-hydroxamate transport system substrate-binding protein